jgi:hypothetical protein
MHSRNSHIHELNPPSGKQQHANSTGAMKGLSSLTLVAVELPEALDVVSISSGIGRMGSLIIKPQFEAMLC